MNGTALLIILGIVVVGAIIAALPLAVRAFRLFKTARRAQAELLPLADGLARRADLAAQKAATLGEKGAELSERLTSLQASVGRVAVLMQAMQEASGRWRNLRRYVR